MENAKTYITSKLEEIIVVLSELKILYKYDASSKEHLIKVYPIDEVNNNQKYQEIESEIIFSFIDKYPHESLVSFTEDDWINIDNPERFSRTRLIKKNALMNLLIMIYFHLQKLKMI